MSAENREMLHLPAGMHYACVQCGRGCEDFDDIRVEPAASERFRALGVARLAMDAGEGREPPSAEIPSPWHEGDAVMRKIKRAGAPTACCMLNEKKLCAIHCEHGLAAKPLVCQSFPFAFIETPGGAYARVSFACTAVLQDSGPGMEEQRRDIEATRATSPHVARAPGEILLAPAIEIAWEDYLQIEADLGELMAGAAAAGRGLVAQSAYLKILGQFLRQARSAAAGGAEASGAKEALAVFRRKMRGGEGARAWDRLHRIAEKGESSALLKRAALGFVLAFHRAGRARRGRAAAAISALASYLRHSTGGGELELLRENRRVPYRAFRRVALDLDEPEKDRLLRRFFGHALFRKDLLMHDEIVFAHNMMLLQFGFIQWHAAALAASEGRERATLDDLREGVRRTEQGYGMHSPLARLMGEHPQLKGVMEGLFHRPLFAHAMTQGESGE